MTLNHRTPMHTQQVPQLVLDHMIESGTGARANMVVTQPRRISAMGVAERIAAERRVLAYALTSVCFFLTQCVKWCAVHLLVATFDNKLANTLVSGTHMCIDIAMF
jgi:hypothetical protein